jgi:hypothetical protein
MITIKNICFTFLLCLIANAMIAQDTGRIIKDTIANTINQLPTTGQGMLYKDGKIYVVVLVLLTIFAGIIFYLSRLDNKISKLEKSL